MEFSAGPFMVSVCVARLFCEEQFRFPGLVWPRWVSALGMTKAVETLRVVLFSLGGLEVDDDELSDEQRGRGLRTEGLS